MSSFTWKNKFKFIQIRHGSCIIELDNTRFIIDPVLYKKNTLEPIKDGIEQNNPLTDISVDEATLKNIDFILLTHLHHDHFDPEILKYYGESVPVICCTKYRKKLSKMGFRNINPVKDKISLKNIEITLTKGKHGTGIVGRQMGKSYGFVLKTSENIIVYITGDTIWCKYVEKTIVKYKPNIIIGFAGSAKINKTKITMDENDIKNIIEKTPDAKLIINHMDAWNHCVLSKEKLRNIISNDNLYIPNDGEIINI